MAKAKQAAIKIKKKRWFKIFAPKLFNEKLLGESFVTDQNLLLNKYVTVNLMGLTGDIKKQGIDMTFRVSALRPEGATTEIISFELVPSAVRRLVKRGNKAIEDSFTVKTKDDVIVRIKPLVFTRTKSKGSTATQIRKTMKTLLIRRIQTIGYYNLIMDLVGYAIQRPLRDELNRIYPIRTCEIRIMKKISGEIKGELLEEPREEKKEAPTEQKNEQAEEESKKPKKPKKEETQNEEPKAAE